MPECGSQIWLCDLPVRFDTYSGCAHSCEYCFAKRNVDISDIAVDETAKSLKNWIDGKRSESTRWADWKIPLHWGGMSDPFQPIEKQKRESYKCLKIFKETQYPFIVSTKGRLIAEDEYLDLLADCNCVVQISMACAQYDKIEKGAPKFEERMEILKKVAPRVKRLIVRVQPYIPSCYADINSNLKRFKDGGAYGVVYETIKYQKKLPGLVKLGADYVLPYDVVLSHALKLRDTAHGVGLKFYCGENRIREYGDSLCCCGIEGLEGFRGNSYNLNHIVHGDVVEPTELMRQPKTGDAFRTMSQTTIRGRELSKNSFAKNMTDLLNNNSEFVLETFGMKKH